MTLRLPHSGLIALVSLTLVILTLGLAWQALHGHHHLAATLGPAADPGADAAGTPALSATLARNRSHMAGLALLALSAGALCLLTLRLAQRRLLHPLDQLHARLARLAAGDASAPARPASRIPEITALHAALDHLCAETAKRAQMQAELARLGDRVVAANRQMTDDLEAAARVQRAQLPPSPRPFAGGQFHAFFRPCRVIAGDTYDCLALPDGRTRIFQIDVAGHGAAAALVSLASHLALKQALLAHPEEELATLVARINRDWAADLPYFTLLALELDPAQGRARLVQCGHPALLRQPARGALQAVGRGGLPVGVLPDARFEAVTLPFRRGDRLILATDGATEAADPQGRVFGDDRFRALVTRHAQDPVPRLFDRIEQALWDWCGTETLEDDITILVLEAT